MCLHFYSNPFFKTKCILARDKKKSGFIVTTCGEKIVLVDHDFLANMLDNNSSTSTLAHGLETVSKEDKMLRNVWHEVGEGGGVETHWLILKVWYDWKDLARY